MCCHGGGGGIGGGAIAHPPEYPLQDGGQTEEIIGHVKVESGDAIAPGVAAVLGNVISNGGNAGTIFMADE